MKRTMLLVVVIGILSTFSLFAFETVQYNVTNEKLQSDKVYDVFFYDTSNDNISGSSNGASNCIVLSTTININTLLFISTSRGSISNRANVVTLNHIAICTCT